MVQVIQVDFHFVRPNDSVIISLWVGLLSKQFFLITVLDACWTSDAWTELQNAAVITLQLVSIAWHIGARPDKAHLSNKHIDQLGEAVHLTVTQPVSHTRDARVVGRGDRIALQLMKHGSELADSKRFAVLTNAFLHKEHRSF